ncbi:MAG: Rho termination factor N-terminal domain-containing protein, partial [Spirochaetota bacterium]
MNEFGTENKNTTRPASRKTGQGGKRAGNGSSGTTGAGTPNGDKIIKENMSGNRLDLAELKNNTISELIQVAKTIGLDGVSGLKKQDLIFEILKTQT